MFFREKFKVAAAGQDSMQGKVLRRGRRWRCRKRRECSHCWRSREHYEQMQSKVTEWV